MSATEKPRRASKRGQSRSARAGADDGDIYVQRIVKSPAAHRQECLCHIGLRPCPQATQFHMGRLVWHRHSCLCCAANHFHNSSPKRNGIIFTTSNLRAPVISPTARASFAV